MSLEPNHSTWRWKLLLKWRWQCLRLVMYPHRLLKGPILTAPEMPGFPGLPPLSLWLLLFNLSWKCQFLCSNLMCLLFSRFYLVFVSIHPSYPPQDRSLTPTALLTILIILKYRLLAPDPGVVEPPKSWCWVANTGLSNFLTCFTSGSPSQGSPQPLTLNLPARGPCLEFLPPSPSVP